MNQTATNTIDKIRSPIVSLVMPCLNEEDSIARCIQKAKKFFRKKNLPAEIIISDNGSIDRSVDIAENLGAKIVFQPKKGYGNAYKKGIKSARGKYIIISDSDNTYDLTDLSGFINPLISERADFIIGTRLKGMIDKGAMPWLHRYIGNPILTGILLKLFKVRVSDAHCGLRAFSKEAYQKINPRTSGMEYASEMIINAAKSGLRILEIPISYGVRLGQSKLSTFSDGWRHLKFMLLYSPLYLFIFPGLIMLFTGISLLLAMYFGPIEILGVTFYLHPMFFGSVLALLGFQLISFGFFLEAISGSPTINNFRIIKKTRSFLNLERTLFLGFGVLMLGIFFGVLIFFHWAKSNFGDLFEIRRSLLSITLIILGIQIIFSGFFYSSLKEFNLRRL